jgi:hypothetical protein
MNTETARYGRHEGQKQATGLHSYHFAISMPFWGLSRYAEWQYRGGCVHE